MKCKLENVVPNITITLVLFVKKIFRGSFWFLLITEKLQILFARRYYKNYKSCIIYQHLGNGQIILK
jgi:hypothetical protein